MNIKHTGTGVCVALLLLATCALPAQDFTSPKVFSANVVGGPFFIASGDLNNDDAPDVVGITSFGYGCAHDGIPAVYAKVESALDWMGQNTGGGRKCNRPDQ